MKKADMKAAMEAGTPVAVATYRPSGEVPARVYTHRAVITALGQSRRRPGRARHEWTGVRVEDGVRVRFLDGPAIPPGSRPITGSRYGRDDHDAETDERVFAPSAVFGPWDEYQAAHARQDEQRASAERARASTEERHKSAAARLAGLGFPARANYRAPSYRGGDREGRWAGVVLDVATAERVARVIGALDAADVADILKEEG